MANYVAAGNREIARDTLHNMKLSLCRGLYQHQAEEWLRLDPRQRLLFIRSVDLYDQPGPTVNHMLEWLHLPAIHIDNKLTSAVFSRLDVLKVDRVYSQSDQATLRAFYFRHNADIASATGFSLAQFGLVPANGP